MTTHYSTYTRIKSISLLLLLATMTAISCVKKDNTTNNYYTLPLNTQPPFIVQGIVNISIMTGVTSPTGMNITMLYQDSAQENVTLALSGLPANVFVDTTWIKRGIPTFSTTILFYDSAAVPGTYHPVITVTTASGVVTSYPFVLKVLPVSPDILGKYANCTSSCSGVAYSDSLYTDPTMPNKIWFSNFNNSGGSLYGIIKDWEITIPIQTVGGTTYSGASSGTVTSHSFGLNVRNGASVCTVNMN